MSSIRLLEHLDVEEPEARQTLCIMMRVRTEAQTFAILRCTYANIRLNAVNLLETLEWYCD